MSERVSVFFVLLSLFPLSTAQLFSTTNQNGDIFGAGSLFATPSPNPVTVDDATDVGTQSNSILGAGLFDPMTGSQSNAITGSTDTAQTDTNQPTNVLTQGTSGANSLATDSITGLFGTTNTANGGIFGTGSLTNSFPGLTGPGTNQPSNTLTIDSSVTQETPSNALTSNTLSGTSLTPSTSPGFTQGGTQGATGSQTGSTPANPLPTATTITNPIGNGLTSPAPSASNIANPALTGNTLTNTAQSGGSITSSIPMGSTLTNPSPTESTATNQIQNGSPLTNPAQTGSGSLQAATNGIASPNVGVATMPGTVFPNTGTQNTVPQVNIAPTSFAPSRSGQPGSQIYTMTTNNRVQAANAGYQPLNMNPFAMNSFYSPRNNMFGGNSFLGLAGMGLLGDQFFEMMPFMAMSGGMGNGGFNGASSQGFGGMGNIGNMFLFSSLFN